MSNSLKKLNDTFLEEYECIFKKYKPIKKIGSGTFGNVYSTIRLNDNSFYAMKTEKINTKYKLLESEAYYLYNLQGFGIPKLITYGHTKKYNILIETLLDKSLHTMFLKAGLLCSITDTCLIGLQILDRLEWIHSKDIIYRDVKPENFLIGINDPNVIYVVDFGLCKKFRSSKTGKHILPKLTKKFQGTLKYCSANAIKGKESSRRDDLISLGYMLIYLLKRELPWINSLEGLDKKGYNILVKSKETNGHGKLFKDLPEELIEYIKYTKNLKFEQDPDYLYLRNLLNNILLKNNLNNKKLNFSWINPKNKELIKIIKNNSLSRRNSPFNRILKKIKEKNNEKSKLKEINLTSLRNDINHISLSNMDYNNFTKSTKILNSKINEIDNNKNNINTIQTTSNLKNKINKIKIKNEVIQKCKVFKNMTNNQKNSSFFRNKNKIKNFKSLNKILYLNNILRNKENISNENNIAEYKKKKYDIRNKKFNNSNISIISDTLNVNNTIIRSNNMSNLYKSSIPYHSNISHNLNFSNDIKYISPLFNYNNNKNNNIRINNYSGINKLNKEFRTLSNTPEDKFWLYNYYNKKNNNNFNNSIFNINEKTVKNKFNIILINNNNINYIQNGESIFPKKKFNFTPKSERHKGNKTLFNNLYVNNI